MKMSCHSTRGAFLSRRKEFWHVRVGTFVFLRSVRKMIALSGSVLMRFSQKLKRQISVWRTQRISLAIVSNIFFSLLSYIKLERKLIERKEKKEKRLGNTSSGSVLRCDYEAVFLAAEQRETDSDNKVIYA